MPKGEVQLSLLVSLDWFLPAPEHAFGAWIVRPRAAGGTITYNTTTLRYIPVSSDSVGAGAGSTPEFSTLRLPRSIEITGLWLLMNNTFTAGQSATFRLNLDGVTQTAIDLVFNNGDRKKGAAGIIECPIDSFLCLECIATTGASLPNIVSIGISYREAPGTEIA